MKTIANRKDAVSRADCRWIAAVSVFLSCPVACSLKEVDGLQRPAVSLKARGEFFSGARLSSLRIADYKPPILHVFLVFVQDSDRKRG